MFLFIFWGVCVILTILNKDKGRKQQLLVTFILCLAAFFFTGTRWNFGGDWQSYYDYFRGIKNLDFHGDAFELDFGFVFFNYLINTIISSYVAFQFLMASIIFFCVYKGIRNLSLVPILSYMIFFSMQNGGIGYVRTTVAACIFLYAYTFVAKKQLVPYLITALFAASIHFSSIVVLPIYWVYWNRSKYSKYLVVFFVSTILFYVFGKLFVSDVSFLGPFLEYKIGNYTSLQESGEGTGEYISVEAAIVGHIVKKFVTFFFLFIYCRKYYEMDSYLRGMTNVYIAGMIFYCAMAPISIQFGRIVPLMDCVEIYLYAYIYSKLKKRSNKIILFLSIIFMSIIRMRGHILPDPLYYNYHNVLFM